MTGQRDMGPLSVLSDESQRTVGDNARRMNLAVARSVGNTIRTTLGPHGMDKMLVDSSGSVVVTNDGVTLIEEMDITHPAVKLIADVASTQETEVGDGTTSAVVLASELLAVAEDRLDQGVHPTTIISGYQRAVTIARNELDDIEIAVDSDDIELLTQIAKTAMTGTVSENQTESLAESVVEAIRIAGNDRCINRDAVNVRTFPGGTVGDSRLIHGVLIDKEPPHPEMPTSASNARVLVYDGDIEATESERDTGTTVSDFDGVSGFIEHERSEIERAVDHIIDAGTDVVLAGEGIDNNAQQRLAAAGVLALRRTSEEDRDRVATATGATRVTSLDITEDDLGDVDRVEQETIRQHVHTGSAPPEQTFVFDDATSKNATILLRGGTDHVLDEVERAVTNGINAVASAVEDGAILPGGGASSIALSLAIRDAASGIEGREQLAVESFAEALDVGPRTLAENAGRDVIDALVELRARHDEGERNTGLAAVDGTAIDTLAAGVVEPRRVTETAIKTAIEAVTMILRIDSVVSAGDLSASDSSEET